MSTRKLGLLQDIILIAAAVSKYQIFKFPKLDALLICLPQNVSAYYLVRYALSRLESEGDKEQATRKSAAAAILRRLDIKPHHDEEKNTDDGRARRTRKENLVLNQYENTIAMDVVAPEDIAVTFEG